MEIRKAEMKDLDQIMEIIRQAKQYFHDNGIPQWQSEYPDETDIRADIENNGGVVLEENGEIEAYCYIAIMQDPNYEVIEGRWLNDSPYAVMHRTCVRNTCKGKGAAGMFVEYAKKKVLETGLCDIRVDTHELNTSMRHMVKKAGFVECGIIHVEDGTPRVASQLHLESSKERSC